MDLVLAITTGALVAGGSFLMMSGALVRFLLGLVLISNAVNLIIFISGRITFAKPALIELDSLTIGADAANSVPQALILTAIVIGFGLFTFTLALALRAFRELGTDETDNMRLAEPEERL